MKFPDKIKIGAHTHKVLVGQTVTDEQGEAWINRNIIKLSVFYPQTQIEATLLHEIIHHSLAHLGYAEDHAYQSEELVEGLSQILYQVLVENQLLVPLEKISISED